MYSMDFGSLLVLGIFSCMVVVYYVLVKLDVSYGKGVVTSIAEEGIDIGTEGSNQLVIIPIKTIQYFIQIKDCKGNGVEFLLPEKFLPYVKEEQLLSFQYRKGFLCNEIVSVLSGAAHMYQGGDASFLTREAETYPFHISTKS